MLSGTDDQNRLAHSFKFKAKRRGNWKDLYASIEKSENFWSLISLEEVCVIQLIVKPP